MLHLLGPGEAYGYEIVSKLTAETDGSLGVTDGTLYPVLYRLERAGFVEVRWETPQRGVPRKYYRLTDAGRQELTELTREWTTFRRRDGPAARPEQDNAMTTADDYIAQVLSYLPRATRERDEDCARTPQSHRGTGRAWATA